MRCRERARRNIDEHGVGSMLAENEELSLKVLLIERIVLAGGAGTIVGLEDDEGLQNARLLASCGRTQDGAICGDFTPAKNTKAKLIGECLKGLTVTRSLLGVVGVEKDVTDGILAGLRKSALEV